MLTRSPSRVVVGSRSVGRGEALAMRWSLTDLDAGTTSLRKQIRRVRGAKDPDTGRRRGQLVEKDLKTDESRATMSLTALVEMLRLHRRDQVAERLAAQVWVDADLILTTSVGRCSNPGTSTGRGQLSASGPACRCGSTTYGTRRRRWRSKRERRSRKCSRCCGTPGRPRRVICTPTSSSRFGAAQLTVGRLEGYRRLRGMPRQRGIHGHQPHTECDVPLLKHSLSIRQPPAGALLSGLATPQ